MITIGSLFSGIGGFELGLERAIPNAKTIWQCEKDAFCRKVLKKHWPDSTIYEDITKMDTQDVPFVDLMCGGFPCQDISVAGKGAGLNGKKSGLWWWMLGCISRLRPSVVVLENVPAITFRGGVDVVGSITELGYDCEWGIIPAGGPQGFGAPHLRKRWFLVGYITNANSKRTQIPIKGRQPTIEMSGRDGETRGIKRRRNYWEAFPTQSPICGRNDGISNRVDRLRALGNAIVPQCSEYIGQCIMKAGLL